MSTLLQNTITSQYHPIRLALVLPFSQIVQVKESVELRLSHCSFYKQPHFCNDTHQEGTESVWEPAPHTRPLFWKSRNTVSWEVYHWFMGVRASRWNDQEKRFRPLKSPFSHSDGSFIGLLKNKRIEQFNNVLLLSAHLHIHMPLLYEYSTQHFILSPIAYSYSDALWKISVID